MVTTTTDRKRELLQVIDQTERETRELLESLRDEDLGRRTDESNWTVGQLAGHIAQVPWGTYVLGRLSRGKNATGPGPLAGPLLNLGNWWNTRRFKNTSREKLLQTWAAAVGDYRRYVETLPDDVLDNGGEVQGRGHMTVADFIRSAPDHTREHAATMRRALAQPS